MSLVKFFNRYITLDNLILKNSTCFDQVKRQSSIIPKNFTESEPLLLIKLFLLLKTKCCVLFSFNKKAFAVNHSDADAETESLSVLRRCRSLLWHKNVVPSAYRTDFDFTLYVYTFLEAAR